MSAERSAVRPNALPLHRPYYRAMVVPVLMVGAGIIPLSLYGLLAFAIIILGGGYAIWWGTERAWGKFSIGT